MTPREKYFTEEGIKTLENRLKTIYSFYLNTQKDEYPIRLPMFGFPALEIRTREECLGHVHELEQILQVKVYEDKNE